MLAGINVQTISLKGNKSMISTLESIRTISLNSRGGAFLHPIPCVSVHLDNLVMQLLVHWLLTSTSLDVIATELTTFNSRLALTGLPRWLTKDKSSMSKTASMIVITITGPRAHDFVSKHTAAFSTTDRTAQLLFNSLNQCSNCHCITHYSNTRINPASCSWSTIIHPIGM